MTRATLEDRFATLLDQLVPDTMAPIGVAVSGGPDSLALLLLAHAARPGRIHAATVDHGLRAESAEEARFVAAICAHRDIPHDILPKPGVPLAGGQAAARDFRYARLDRWCADHRLPVLLTGHHANDQAETVLMRLARGSGVAGLSGIRAVRPRRYENLLYPHPLMQDHPRLPFSLRHLRVGIPQASRMQSHNYSVVRPLLGFRKQTLAAFLRNAGIVAVDDPSNASQNYDRTHFRALLGEQSLLDPERLAATARNMADAEAALDWATARTYERNVTGNERMMMLDAAGLPTEILRRVVRMVLYDVEEYVFAGEPGEIADGPPLMRLIDRVRAGTTSTLGNVQVRGGTIWKFRPLWRSRRL